MNALRNFLSVDELRISSIVICFLFSFCFVVYLYATGQPVESGLLDLTKSMIYAITTVNTVQAISYGYSSYYSKTGATNTTIPTINSDTTNVGNVSNTNNISNIEDRV